MRAAEFASSSAKNIEFRNIEQKFEDIRLCREKKMACRRARLKLLLEEEEKLLQEEFKTTTMGLAERRQWLEARARALKQKQNLEQCEKDQYVEEQLNRAWSDNSDDVRVQDSKMAVLRAVEGRKRQLEEAVARKILEEEECRKMDAMMEKEWKLKEQALLNEVQMKEAKRIEAIDILHEQMAMVESLRREEKEAVKAEMAAMNKRWREEEIELKKQQEEKRCYQV